MTIVITLDITPRLANATLELKLKKGSHSTLDMVDIDYVLHETEKFTLLRELTALSYLATDKSVE